MPKSAETAASTAPVESEGAAVRPQMQYDEDGREDAGGVKVSGTERMILGVGVEDDDGSAAAADEDGATGADEGGAAADEEAAAIAADDDEAAGIAADDDEGEGFTGESGLVSEGVLLTTFILSTGSCSRCDPSGTQ